MKSTDLKLCTFETWPPLGTFTLDYILEKKDWRQFLQTFSFILALCQSEVQTAVSS